jgi:hypothetical protein
MVRQIGLVILNELYKPFFRSDVKGASLLEYSVLIAIALVLSIAAVNGEGA